MPGSSELFDDVMLAFFATHRGGVFDIGPGMGKVGKLAKQAGCCPIDCIEIHAPYVEQFKLRKIYEKVEIGDAYDLIKTPSRKFGIVVFGDTLEHLSKSKGRDLLEYLTIRSKWIIVKYPVNTDTSCLFQGDTPWKNDYESHVSIWSEMDFHGLDVWHRKNGPMRLAIIKGYFAK